MRLRIVLFCFVFLLASFGCQPSTYTEGVPISPPLSTSIQQSPESAGPRIAQTEQVGIPATVQVQPTPGNTLENEYRSLWNGEQMPVFLEVIQTTIMGNNTVQDPTFGVGPAIYFYSPESKVLTLHPTVALESKTEVLIGVTAILQTPGQVFEKREIVQFPSVQPASVQVAAFDKNIGSIELVYDNESFRLSPGDSRTFKQAGGFDRSTNIILISNHGRLEDIQPVLFDGSWR